MKIIKFLLFFFLLVVIILFFIEWFMTQPCTPPVKPKSVPDLAFWAGGCDGGEWIIFDDEEEIYRAKIYRGSDGILELDGYFVLKNCDGRKKIHVGDISHFSFNSNERLPLLLLKDSECYLEMKPPALGGEYIF